MTPTLTRPRFTPVRNAGGTLLVVASVAGVVVLAFVMLGAMRLPGFVSRLTVANPTLYGVEIEVREAQSESGGWFTLGTFGRESVRNTYEVLDSGRAWTVRFWAGGVDAGQMTITRDQLERNRWRLTVPAEVADRLAAEGVSPSARF